MTFPAVREVGEVRPSQLLYTYGVGSIIDLPNISVMVMGLEDWDRSKMTAIGEPRLLEAVQKRLGPQVRALLAPPRGSDIEPGGPLPSEDLPSGIPVVAFPRWLYCTACRTLAPVSQGTFELKHDRWRPDRTGYQHTYCPVPNGKHPAFPARFLMACSAGHLDDFPWDYFVHRQGTDCPGPLRLDNVGPSGEAREVQVSCKKCNAKRRMSEAFGERGNEALPLCRGRRMHLRDEDPSPCKEEPRTILIGASNLWFPVTMSVFSIPTSANKLDQAVADLYSEYLEHAESPADLGVLLKTPPLRKLSGFAANEVWEAVEAFRDPPPKPKPLDLRSPEWALLANPSVAPASADFRLKEVPVPKGTASWLRRVVLVERLREVQTVLGFTRIDSAVDEEGETTTSAKRAALSRQATSWLPAVEVRGEGLFLQVHEDAIAEWAAREGLVAGVDRQFRTAHREWRRRRGISQPERDYPGLRYVLLHSLSHALARQLSLECGYTGASLKERIYSREPGDEDDKVPMAGILLYTAAADSEGTLGGLTGLGEPSELGRHLATAFEEASFCSSDPLCSDHRPSSDGAEVHGAACHSCLFSPETFCERGNRYLDRSVLAHTIAGPLVSIFGEPPTP